MQNDQTKVQNKANSIRLMSVSLRRVAGARPAAKRPSGFQGRRKRGKEGKGKDRAQEQDSARQPLLLRLLNTLTELETYKENIIGRDWMLNSFLLV